MGFPLFVGWRGPSLQASATQWRYSTMTTIGWSQSSL
jgi:hypothetical protein